MLVLVNFHSREHNTVNTVKAFTSLYSTLFPYFQIQVTKVAYKQLQYSTYYKIDVRLGNLTQKIYKQRNILRV